MSYLSLDIKGPKTQPTLNFDPDDSHITLSETFLYSDPVVYVCVCLCVVLP